MKKTNKIEINLLKAYIMALLCNLAISFILLLSSGVKSTDFVASMVSTSLIVGIATLFGFSLGVKHNKKNEKKSKTSSL